jgi:hypothetical protein
MRKFILAVALGVASWVGVHSAAEAVEPTASIRTGAGKEQRAEDFARRQFFGPYSEEQARQFLRKILRTTNYNCGYSRTIRGWWVWVDFPN